MNKLLLLPVCLLLNGVTLCFAQPSLPWEVDGDGVSTPGDQAVVAWWLAEGSGSFVTFLSSLSIGEGVIDATEFFYGPDFDPEPSAAPLALSLGSSSSLQHPICYFLRGDANSSEIVDIADAVFIFDYISSGSSTPKNLDSADANDSGLVDIADGVFLLSYLQSQGSAPPSPFPATGEDPTLDALTPDCDIEGVSEAFGIFMDSTGSTAMPDGNRTGFTLKQVVLWDLTGDGYLELIYQRYLSSIIKRSEYTSSSGIDPKYITSADSYVEMLPLIGANFFGVISNSGDPRLVTVSRDGQLGVFKEGQNLSSPEYSVMMGQATSLSELSGGTYFWNFEAIWKLNGSPTWSVTALPNLPVGAGSIVNLIENPVGSGILIPCRSGSVYLWNGTTLSDVTTSYPNLSSVALFDDEILVWRVGGQPAILSVNRSDGFISVFAWDGTEFALTDDIVYDGFVYMVPADNPDPLESSIGFSSYTAAGGVEWLVYSTDSSGIFGQPAGPLSSQDFFHDSGNPQEPTSKPKSRKKPEIDPCEKAILTGSVPLTPASNLNLHAALCKILDRLSYLGGLTDSDLVSSQDTLSPADLECISRLHDISDKLNELKTQGKITVFTNPLPKECPELTSPPHGLGIPANSGPCPSRALVLSGTFLSTDFVAAICDSGDPGATPPVPANTESFFRALEILIHEALHGDITECCVLEIE